MQSLFRPRQTEALGKIENAKDTGMSYLCREERSKGIKNIFILFVLISLALCLSGCFTTTLWKQHDEKAESVPTSPGKPDQLLINLKEKKICISYHPDNAADSKEKQYLIVDQVTKPSAIGPNYDLHILHEIFNKTSHFNIKTVVTNAQHHGSADLFVITLFGTVHEDDIILERDENAYFANIFKKRDSEKHVNSCFLSGMTVGEHVLAKQIIIQRWKTLFGDNLYYDSLCPVAWINSKDEIDTSLTNANDYDPSKVNGVIMALTHPLRGIKYVRVRFNVRKFSNYMHNTSDRLLDSPIVFNNYKNEPFYFIYGAFPSNGRLWWVPIQGFHWDKNNNCVTDDWVQLSTHLLTHNKMLPGGIVNERQSRGAGIKYFL